MKNYIWFALICGFTLIPGTAWVQRAPAPNLSATQLQSVIETDFQRTCAEKVPIVPQTQARVFPQQRIERTLNGVWRGRVRGEYDKELLTADGYLNVDYYMIVDVKRQEALVFEQLTSTRAAPSPGAGAPRWSYLMCGRERYLPAHPAQVHEFQKVSDNVQDARRLLRTSTGLPFADTGELVLSDAWQRLVETRYFDTSRSPAYAGGLFKPFELGMVVNEERQSLLSMNMQAEYRGGGMTAARFQAGVPIRGFERGQFLGVTTESGDYLVSSLGNGVETEKEATEAGLIKMFFDKVVIGPLTEQPEATNSRSSGRRR